MDVTGQGTTGKFVVTCRDVLLYADTDCSLVPDLQLSHRMIPTDPVSSQARWQ